MNVINNKLEQKKIKTPSPIYEKNVDCPICHIKINLPAVRTSSLRILSKDSDFFTSYKDPSPLLYDVWVCSSCGYAALSSKFESVTSKQRDLIIDNITKKWNSNRTYPIPHSIDVSIEKYQLAILNCIVKQSKESEAAFLCLKTAWLYRIKNDSDGEKRFLERACEGFTKALETENTPLYGMDSPTLEYLIGELFRRTGNDKTALYWFGRVMSSRTASRKIKDMALDQKDLIKNNV